MNAGTTVLLPSPTPTFLYLRPAMSWSSLQATAISLVLIWDPGMRAPLRSLIPGSIPLNLCPPSPHPRSACLALFSSLVLHLPIPSRSFSLQRQAVFLLLSPYCSSPWGCHHLLGQSISLYPSLSLGALLPLIASLAVYSNNNDDGDSHDHGSSYTVLTEARNWAEDFINYCILPKTVQSRCY